MRKLAIIFVVAVLVPSMALAWLAFRSLRDQQFILERQQSVVYQALADSVASKVKEHLLQEQERFVTTVGSLLQSENARGLTTRFDTQIRSNWALAKVGFVVTLRGDLLSPSPESGPEAQEFYVSNEAFLNNGSPSEVYQNSLKVQNTAQVAMPLGQAAQSQNIRTKGRNVLPQNSFSQASQSPSDGEIQLSRFVPLEAEFRELVAEAPHGIVGRFHENQLNLLVWHRPAQLSNLIFGAQIDMAKLTDELRPLFQSTEPFANEICLALLNDGGKPVALSTNGFSANWKRPFVATEIGEELPHWEVAGYLLNPDGLNRAAKTTRLTLGLLILILVTTIGVGGWLIVADINRQMLLARQKTDFVSNVSHELKTPLTSIRMFSELLAEGRVVEPEKQRSYLNIIAVEAARLTRLINNVLDFARMERGEKKYHFERCDFVEVVREMCDTFRPQLEENKFSFDCRLCAKEVGILADRDAISQVIVNLLSNAEKFSTEKKEIELRVEIVAGQTQRVQLTVADRGVGIAPGYEEKIFEQFFRIQDVLSSSTQGSGLGLTLARQIARAHQGELFYKAREGGGSCFILQLPMT